MLNKNVKETKFKIIPPTKLVKQYFSILNEIMLYIKFEEVTFILEKN